MFEEQHRAECEITCVPHPPKKIPENKNWLFNQTNRLIEEIVDSLIDYNNR